MDFGETRAEPARRTPPARAMSPRIAAQVISALAMLLAAADCAHATPAERHGQDMERLGPKQDAAIFWVGHSLVEGRAKSDWGDISLMSLVGRFAQSRGLGHRMTDHTLWGTSLAGLWRGRPHGFTRDASEMVAKREAFQRAPGQYDTLVLTESLPVDWAADHEYSAYYVRRFACPLVDANPRARVYLYQTWVNLQGGDPNSKFPPPHRFDWRAEMLAQRKVWDRIADEASRPSVRAPGGWLSRLGWHATSDGGCPDTFPVFIVPVGQALVALLDRLAAPQPGDVFERPDGGRLTMADLFGNPYVDWPRDWPLAKGPAELDPKATLERLTRRDPDQPHDDIHLSAAGIYFAALVHFATIYRQSPLGLPAPADIGDGLAHTLQCVAWGAVVRDDRAGVLGDAGCKTS